MARVGKIICFLILLGILTNKGWSQVCTALGQNPNTAFPICGSTTFTQKIVPLCSNGTVPAKGCSNPNFATANPYWYKFTCYSSGTLSFVITPLNTVPEDYDWQLFDITGRDPMDVFTDASLVLTANWAGTYGPTGASASGTKVFECASNPAANISTFAPMPNLVAGHQYLLLVSHFLNQGETSEVGYTLAFGGSANTVGAAVITDPTTPAIQNAYGVCDGTEIIVTLNKKMKCSSIAADGSDFTVSGGPVPISILSATGSGCTSGFDMDSVRLKLNRILSPGTYTVTAKTGSDGNTLIDNCDYSLTVGDKATLKYTAAQPTPMDSISPVVCITDSLRLVFSKPMKCNSIAADGSDFRITGPATVSVKTAKGVCTNGVTTVINIFLTAPIKVNGTFTITLFSGSDGNTLIDECGEMTPAGSTLSFTTKNITTADFQPVMNAGCKSDTLLLNHNGNGGANQWQWVIDGTQVSTAQNYTLISKAFGSHTAKLTVANGKCTDTASRVFTFVDQTVKAAFASLDSLCPTDTLHFTDLSTPNTIAWKWDFGNGVTSTSQTPPAQNYPLTGRFNNYFIKLSVQNSYNCADTTYKVITVLASCYVAVPSAFTPNGDGLNDYLYPLNAFKAGEMEFRVYNRYGQVIFETKDWTKKWDGRVNSQLQGSGTYVWTLSYTNKDTGQKVFLKGTTVLIR
jgi:gliding motility-associated-like protein